MRNISSFTLALSIAVPLSGCPGDDTGSDETTTITPTSTSATESGEETVTPETDGVDTGSGSATDSGGDGGFCIHECTGDADCMVGGMDAGLTCQDGTCAGDPVDPCADDNECVALLSGWSAGMACTAGGGECDALMQICLDVGGEGHCVSGPSEFFMCETVPGFEEIMTQDIDGMDVTVCGNPNAACADEGFCYSPCGSDEDCMAPSAPVCNTDSGFCECGEDQHCVDGMAGDVCNSGLCGCSDDSVCTNPFDGGTVSCGQL